MGTPPPPSAEAASGSAIQHASELKPNARIVYPNQGVCRIVGLQSKEIAGHRLELVEMVREDDGATILVPVPKVASIGLRKVADATDLADVFDLLASSFDDPELDWKVRHRMHGDLMAAGGVLGVAEVLKALQGLANLRPLPQKERERYDAARHLLVNELAVALGVPHATAEDYIDLALIPPPGTKRPASKPRKLATLPPRPRRDRPRMPRSADGLELDELVDEELDGALPGVEGEEAGAASGEETESGEGGAMEAEGEAPREAEKPAPTKAAKAKTAKSEAKTAKAAAAPKPAATKPAAPKPAATKPAAPKPAATKPAATRPAGKKEASAAKPAAKKPAATKKAATTKSSSAPPRSKKK